MTGLDLAVMGAYFLAVIAIGAHFTRQQKDASDYFLGGHSLPWWVVMLSIVATETSALTVISIPGVGARGDLTFLQLPLGYLVGRIGVAIWLLPGYFRGEQETAYTRLETRFGKSTRKAASAVFMCIRALGDSVRAFATAIPLHIVTELSIFWCGVIVKSVSYWSRVRSGPGIAIGRVSLVVIIMNLSFIFFYQEIVILWIFGAFALCVIAIGENELREAAVIGTNA